MKGLCLSTALALVAGVGALHLQQALAWRGGGERWPERDWWDRSGYWGGHSHQPSYGWGYPGYAWGYPGYDWGSPRGAPRPVKSNARRARKPQPPSH